jgi:hypothetical protein
LPWRLGAWHHGEIMALSMTVGRLVVEATERTVVITVGPARNRAVTSLLLGWSALLLATHIFVIISFARRGVLVPVVSGSAFVGCMLVWAAVQLRGNLKGLVRATITPTASERCAPRVKHCATRVTSFRASKS